MGGLVRGEHVQKQVLDGGKAGADSLGGRLLEYLGPSLGDSGGERSMSGLQISEQAFLAGIARPVRLGYGSHAEQVRAFDIARGSLGHVPQGPLAHPGEMAQYKRWMV